MDALAVTYADELARWGVETTIVVPGSFTTGTNHFARIASTSTRPTMAPAWSAPSRTTSAPTSCTGSG
jgi:hypothetical protein